MSGLVEFLRARLDDDYEAVQRVLGTNVMAAIRDGVPAPHWVPSPNSEAGIWDTNHQPRVKFAWPRERDHIIRHDPARVLAEVEAKQRILKRHARCGSGVGRCDDGGHGWDDVEGGGCADLGDLARPFADHPDYEERWKP